MRGGHHHVPDRDLTEDRRPRRVRHQLRFRLLEVQRTEMLTQHMVRITLGGEDLAGFESPGFDDHIKLFIPAPGEEAPPRPELSERGVSFPAGQAHPAVRDFTPRHHDPVAGTLQIDFALHETGPASEWARQARPGQKLGIGGPRGSFILPIDFDWHLLIGDETAAGDHPSAGRTPGRRTRHRAGRGRRQGRRADVRDKGRGDRPLGPSRSRPRWHGPAGRGAERRLLPGRRLLCLDRLRVVFGQAPASGTDRRTWRQSQVDPGLRLLAARRGRRS